MMATALAVIGTAQSVVLYAAGRSVQDQNIALRGWGSGRITESTGIAYEGTTSLGVSTRNFFQGGSIILNRPVELSGAFGDKNNLLRVTLRTSDAGVVFGGGGGGRPGGGPGGGPGGRPGGGFGPGGPGGGAGIGLGDEPGGGRAGGPGGGGAAPAADALKTVRVIVTTTDGLKSEAYIPVATSAAGERGWRMVAIPLQAIRGFERTNKIVREVAFSGDATTTFYVGEVRVVNDSTKITSDIREKAGMNLALGDEITLTGYGFGGASVLKYSWDFDATDGIQEDATGQVVRRKFRKAGRYTVTLTVSDVYGLKAPASTTMEVVVNP